MNVSIFVVQHIESGLYLKGRPFASFAKYAMEISDSYARKHYMTDSVQKARWFKYASHASLALIGFDKSKFKIIEI